MPIELNEQTPGTKLSNEGETINELAHRHMKDQNHTATDDEIRNAKLDLDEDVEVRDDSLFAVDNATVIPPLPGESETTDAVEGGEKKDDDNVPNPYDVLNS